MANYIFIALLSVVLGYGAFVLLMLLLPRKLRAENNFQRTLILNEAKQKIAVIKAEEFGRTTVKIQAALEELDGSIEDRQADLKAFEADIEERQKYLEQEEARIQKREKDLEALQQKSKRALDDLTTVKTELENERLKLQERLASISGLDITGVRTGLVDDRVQKRQIETNKHMKLIAEELHTNAQRLASRMLARTHSRYAPEFIWPKGVNHVEVLDRRTAELLATQENGIISDLAALTEHVNITFVPPEKPEHIPIIRLAGGFGIYKEAAKLALEELIPRGPNGWNRIKDVYEKHRRNLEARAVQLGKNALMELKLDGMHVEILKMVGALNWRTSYRQNQYYHSIEVSKLAGILAVELGVDPDQAKRCGLLHDIGKSIDYRIEGSHAVISGDYADRFGENKIICDTVMSHHADLLVETPLAYVLMAADTLSGARPGARVNLEEGYQDRLSSIQDVVRAFPGVIKVEIMNGAREVHVEVNHKKVRVEELEAMSAAMARQIEENVTYPGQIKILVTRRFESIAVA